MHRTTLAAVIGGAVFGLVACGDSGADSLSADSGALDSDILPSTSDAAGSFSDAASRVDGGGRTDAAGHVDGGTITFDSGAPIHHDAATALDAATPEDAAPPAPDAPPAIVTGDAGAGIVFSPYKDVGINMNWNTNVAATMVSGDAGPLASDLVAHGGSTITLAFATGECGSENWAGVSGAAMATANVPVLAAAGAKYIISTGGAAGSFTCGTDTGMATFIDRWAGAGLIGVDFDIEAGQTTDVIDALIARIETAHVAYPALRFSLTLATLAPSASGATVASSLGAAAVDGFNTYGDECMAAVKSTLGFAGTAATWPSYLTVNLMTMDYGTAGADLCVVANGACEMGQSAIQAAYDLHDKWGVPYSNVELTPMIGGNDNQAEQFTLGDVDVMTAFAREQGLAGLHYWSYDRDIDCAVGYASSTCNSMGTGYAGAYGYLKRFLADGLH